MLYCKRIMLIVWLLFVSSISTSLVLAAGSPTPAATFFIDADDLEDIQLEATKSPTLSERCTAYLTEMAPSCQLQTRSSCLDERCILCLLPGGTMDFAPSPHEQRALLEEKHKQVRAKIDATKARIDIIDKQMTQLASLEEEMRQIYAAKDAANAKIAIIDQQLLQLRNAYAEIAALEKRKG